MMLRQWSSNSGHRDPSHSLGAAPGRLTGPHSRNEIPGMIAVCAGPWLTVRLHPNHRLLGARKLISKTKSIKWKNQED